MDTSDQRRRLGRRGEDFACEYLEGRGYRVVERNFRTMNGEIDIIARRGGLTVFVEVKTRSGGGFGEPEEAVTPQKVRRIRRLAGEYLSQVNRASEVRFDVVGVRIGTDGRVLGVDHLEDAF